MLMIEFIDECRHLISDPESIGRNFESLQSFKSVGDADSVSIRQSILGQSLSSGRAAMHSMKSIGISDPKSEIRYPGSWAAETSDRRFFFAER